MPYTKINSNSIKDMNVRDSENTNTNLLEENIGGKLLDISLGDDFFNLTPKQKKKVNSKEKRQHTEWEKIFESHIVDKGIITQIYKESIKHNNQKTNSLI